MYVCMYVCVYIYIYRYRCCRVNEWSRIGGGTGSMCGPHFWVISWFPSETTINIVVSEDVCPLSFQGVGYEKSAQSFPA